MRRSSEMNPSVVALPFMAALAITVPAVTWYYLPRHPEMLLSSVAAFAASAVLSFALAFLLSRPLVGAVKPGAIGFRAGNIKGWTAAVAALAALLGYVVTNEPIAVVIAGAAYLGAAEVIRQRARR